jgi:GTP-binding protein
MPSPAALPADLPVVAIVGRANVGKSTLWNRIIERRRALISPAPHTTRDRNEETAVWRGRPFFIVDTGGADADEDEIGRGIVRQAERAVEQADAVLFLIDAKTGVLDQDRALAKRMRKCADKVLLVMNKVDHHRDVASAAGSRAQGLGFGEPALVSAVTGKGVGDLLDRVYERLEKRGTRGAKDAEPADGRAREESLRIVIMGRPNVGKSSLTNAILGEERVIVSAVPHTTREPQDTRLMYKGREIVLIDTAGTRKKSRAGRGIETAAIEKNRQALRRADVAFLVLDAAEEPGARDRELAGLMKNENKGLVIVVNKWDLVEGKTAKSAKDAEARIRAAFPFLSWAPVVFVSAKTGKRTGDLLDLALAVQKERGRVIEYNALNRLLKSVIRQKRPLQILGPKSPYVHDMAQVATRPPTFLVTIRGEKRTVHANWLKFLEKRMREKFGFEGTPIIVKATNVSMAKAVGGMARHAPYGPDLTDANS